MGFLARRESPRFVIKMALEWFQKTYQLNMNEAEKTLHEYKSLNDLFTRRLKVGTRPIATNFCVHPADSRITQRGVIEKNTLIQAKGLTYSLSDFLGSLEKSERYEGGTFLVYYLCPTDYHRVHSPVEGTIKEIKKMGADLWPVHDESVQEIPQLFIQNERVAVTLSTQLGPVETVFVGATNVGSIEIFKNIGDYLNRGEELGMFQFGSTVVMVYPKSIKVDVAAIPQGSVLMGAALNLRTSAFS